MKTKSLITSLAILCLVLFSSLRTLACDQSSLSMGSVTPNGDGTYTIALTFCAGNGSTGAGQNTGRWAVDVFGANIVGFPASLISPATGAVYLGTSLASGKLVQFNPQTAGAWWTCISGCGSSTSACVNFSITTSALPGAIRILGAEGGNLAFGGCEEAGMTVYPNPACASSSIASNVTVSAPDCSSRLLDVSVAGGSGAFSHIWYTSGFPATEDLMVTSSTTATQFFGATWDALGCPTTYSASVAFNPVLANAGSDKAIYLGYGASCTSLSASASGGSGPYSYLWSNGATTASTNVCPTSNTTYTVTVTDASGCSSTDAVAVSVTDVRCGPGGSKVVVCRGGQTRCVPSSQVANILAAGGSLGSCGSSKMAEDAVALEATLEVYPVPASGAVHIDLLAVNEGNASLEIFDLQGQRVQLVSQEQLNAGMVQSYDTDVSALANGLYLVRLTDGAGEVLTRKLVVAH